MLSSTPVLGLLVISFVDAFARPSRENPVISYAQHLPTVGLSGVHLESPKSKHPASDSTNPFSRPIDNARRAEMRNISSLDALRPALSDNSNNPVKTIKSTPVVNDTVYPTCYRSREAAPIATPAHCNIAIYEIVSRGDPEEEEIWSGRKTWIWGTCKVELVPMDHYDEYISRQSLALAASLIKRSCITATHGYRGGHVAVGLRVMFELKVWASTSSGTMNETIPALSSSLDAPDLLDQERIQR